MFDTPHDWIDLGYAKLPHWKVGTGPDVVLVHGWPLDSRTWRDFLPRLARNYTCHLIDLPGAGQSQWDENTPIGVAEHAHTLRLAIDALELQDYALVAHDSGAVFARLCAAGDPERVRALVLGNTEIPGHEPWLLKLIAYAAKLPGAMTAWLGLLRFAPLRRSLFGLGPCFADKDLIDGEFFDLFIGPLMDDPELREGQRQLVKNLDFGEIHGLEAVHARITAPVRFIWGVSDPYFPVDKARAMPAQFAGPADLVTLEPGKLFAHEEFPQLFLDYAEPTLAAGFAAARTAA